MPLSANHVISCDDKNYGCSGGYMENVYNFFKVNGTITGGEYDSDEVNNDGFNYMNNS